MKNSYSSAIAATVGSVVLGISSLVHAGTIERISETPGGMQFTSSSFVADFSDDGRWIVLETGVSLVPADTDSLRDVYVMNRVTREVELISRNAQGDPANENSFDARISGDGSFVVFETRASNLDPNDQNGSADIFLYSRDDETVERLSVDGTGADGDGSSYDPSIDYFGEYVVFTSSSTNLVDNDSNGFTDIFLRKVGAVDSITLVSVNNSGNSGNQNSAVASLSGDGSKVVFESLANDLVSDDGNGQYDIFLWDIVESTTVRVSEDEMGHGGDQNSEAATCSYDGRYVIFSTESTTFSPEDEGGYSQIFVRDMQKVADWFTAVSVSEEGQFGDDESDVDAGVGLSSDGRWAVFETDATNLGGNPSSSSDIYLRDLWNNKNYLVTETEPRGSASDDAYSPRLSDDGKYVGFSSSSQKIVVPDDNGTTSDMFLWTRSDPSPPAAAPDNSALRAFLLNKLKKLKKKAKKAKKKGKKAKAKKFKKKVKKVAKQLRNL